MSTSSKPLTDTESFHRNVEHVSVHEEAEIEAINSLPMVASMCSLLDSIGLKDDECKEHYYDLLAEALRSADAEYIDGFAVIASGKLLHSYKLVDLFGEDGYRIVIDYLRADTCNKHLVAELVMDILTYLNFTEDARKTTLRIMGNLTCRQLKGLIVALLLVPPGGNIE